MLTCLAGQAFEAKDLLAFSVGPFVVKPRVALAEEYNDNLYYQSTGQVSDWITSIGPGVDIRLGRPEAENVFHLLYGYNHYWYAANGQADGDAHNLTLNGTVRHNRLTSITTGTLGYMNTIYGGLQAVADGSEILYQSANVERLPYSLNQSLTYQISEKTDVHGTFRLSGIEYQQNQPLAFSYFSQNQWRGLAGAGYKVRPKVQALAEVYYGQTANNPNSPTQIKPPHMETVGGYAGATIAFTEKLSGTLKGGYEESIFGGEEGSFGAPVASVSLTSRLREKTSLALGYNRTTAVSVQSSYQGTPYAYVSDVFTFSVAQAVGTVRPWFFTLGASYNSNAYETGVLKGASSDYLGFNFGVGYQVTQWLVANLAYIYTHSTSEQNQSSVDYSVNRVTLSASIGY